MHFHSSTTIQSPQQAGTHLNKKTADFQKEPTPLAMLAGDFRTHLHFWNFAFDSIPTFCEKYSRHTDGV